MVCGKTLLSLVSLRVLLEVNKGNAYSTTALSDNRPDSSPSPSTRTDLWKSSKTSIAQLTYL
ncbi:hypothetical protein BRADI_4g15765v3 [Brachypodium distachyon]|uniref:Uncharacterized protein n=1 Tax=Brachypodium distachyon TaxID=15368 RepID=A0A2K2CN42_BRADI|nr:hypothetical protein BRADI_4g15765v3 [Brachypodium distachyon]PNT63440.1 hypothetical protein BRADI_4g15765v3 [Brachypodium distachyon]